MPEYKAVFATPDLPSGPVFSEGFEPHLTIAVDGVGAFLIMIKRTPEELKAIEEDKNRKPLDRPAELIKLLQMVFAVEVRELKPGMLGETLPQEKGYTWMCTDKWKEAKEWSKLPDNIAEKIKELANPKPVVVPDPKPEEKPAIATPPQ